MKKTLTAVALAGAMSFSIVPAFAQGAPEPPQGAQPMDNAGGGANSNAMGGESMGKSSMKKSGTKHKMKHRSKHHMKKSM